jgi:galactokinase/mevalonate kinase-like predicted kinase
VLANTVFNEERAKALADAAEAHWQSILRQDVVEFGRTMRAGFEAQVAMFPNMMNERVAVLIQEYCDRALGWKLTGAGGGGYLILVSEKPIPGAIRILARRETE